MKDTPITFLQEANLKTLCDNVTNVASQHCPAVLTQTQTLSVKYHRVFELFRECHNVYEKKVVTQEEILKLCELLKLETPTSRNNINILL